MIKKIVAAANLMDLQSQFPSTEKGWTYRIEIQQSLYNGRLILPENCKLLFEGVFFQNGIVRLNNAEQNDVLYEVWSNVTVEGYFKNNMIRPEWFGAHGKKTDDEPTLTEDNSISINRCLEISNRCGCEVLLLPRKYEIKNSIRILSGTSLSGVIEGNFDESVYRGSIICNKSNTSIAAISVNSGYNRTIDNSGCYRFSIKNLTVWGNNSDKGIEIVFAPSDSSVKNKVPRSALLENILIRNCLTGIYMDSFSYIKLSRIELFGGNPNATGLHIAYPKGEQKGTYREFGWFSEIIINGCPKDSILIESGNNLYFSKIDTNDSETGFKIDAKSNAFSIFIDEMNSMRCTHAFWAHASQSAITRIRLSGLTCDPGKDKEDAISLYFTREGSYTVDDSIFTDLFGGTSQHANSYFIKASAGLSGTIFDNIRAYNKISGISNAYKKGLIRLKRSGVITASPTTNTYSHVLTSNSLIDFSPVVLVSTTPYIANTAYITNEQGGEMRLNINFTQIPTQSIKINYLLDL